MLLSRLHLDHMFLVVLNKTLALFLLDFRLFLADLILVSQFSGRNLTSKRSSHIFSRVVFRALGSLNVGLLNYSKTSFFVLLGSLSSWNSQCQVESSCLLEVKLKTLKFVLLLCYFIHMQLYNWQQNNTRADLHGVSMVGICDS